MELSFAAAGSQAGQKARISGREIAFIESESAPLGEADLVFSALPHGESAKWSRRASDAGAKVVDLSSDFRPGHKDADGIPYGLTELTRADIPEASIVANPGCYPTAILIGLAPLIKRCVIAPNSTITVSAASGVTGAGFTPKPELLFAEVVEDFRAYSNANGHRHLIEMRETMKRLGGNQELVFIPHLLPVARGILATMTVPLAEKIADPLELWRAEFKGEAFIEISDETPSLHDVVNRNVVRINAVNAANVRQPTLIITSAIDNLLKGAAGQAVQNANLMLGFAETTGLPA
jgi:N-acetyl-gamma-glutamyl-phosphate reductase